MFNTINLEIKNNIAFVQLNRPELKNAINNLMIEELHLAFDALVHQNNFKLVVISGAGDSFCSGADLNWLSQIHNQSYDENYNEAFRLIELLYKIKEFPKPVISKVIGSAVGAGVGIMLASDIIIVQNDTKIGLSEVRIGVVPAAIINFIIERIGITKSKELLLTGNRIDGKIAFEIGLVNYTFDSIQEMENAIVNKISDLNKNSTNAMKMLKEMINKIQFLSKAEIFDYVAQSVADLRLDPECQEGISSFLEKRKPNW